MTLATKENQITMEEFIKEFSQIKGKQQLRLMKEEIKKHQDKKVS